MNTSWNQLNEQGYTFSSSSPGASFFTVQKDSKNVDIVFYSLNPQTMEDIFSGPGRSDEMDTLLFRNSDEPDCTLRLCALQKLKVSMICSSHKVFICFQKLNIFLSLTPPPLKGISGHQSGPSLYSHKQQVAED